MLATKSYSAVTAGSPLEPHIISRRDPGPHDVLIEIMYCGICHSDIHLARGHLPGALFPMVPGHEIVGKVIKTGGAVAKHRIGDIVGVGCMIDSCRECTDCKMGEEQYCKGMVGTYGGYEKDGETPAYGGYSTQITVDEHYVLKVSPRLNPAAVAPLLCAGITTYSPLRHWRVGKGSRVGVIGLGGLGHMAVKLAAAMGADVTVFSTSEGKRADATRLGASEFAVSKSPDTFKRLIGCFDLILNTVSASVDYDAYSNLLKRDGTMVLLGLPDGPVSLNGIGLLMRRTNLSGSMIGGIRETQELLDFCAAHQIVSDIETISVSQVNDAYERVLKGEVRYRFVIDMASLQ